MIAERANIACYKTEHSLKTQKKSPPFVDSPKGRDLRRRAVGRSRNRGYELASVENPGGKLGRSKAVCVSVSDHISALRLLVRTSGCPDGKKRNSTYFANVD